MNEHKPSIQELRKTPVKSVTGAYVAPRDMTNDELLDTLCIHKEFTDATLALILEAQEEDSKLLPFLAEAPARLTMIHVLARELFSRIPPEVNR